MAKLFLSYNRRSGAAAKTLCDDFEALGHTVWFDQDLSGGESWWKKILAMIRENDVFVFLMDPDSLESTACQREYGYAADLGKSILPVLVSGEVSTNLLPPALSQIQFVDYRTQDREAAFRLARALAQIPTPRPLPDPLPAPPPVPISYLGGLAAQVDTAATLTYEQQSGLLFDLKRHVRDPSSARDARILLERLRKRRDLLATVAEEIDELLPVAENAPADRPPAQLGLQDGPRITPPAAPHDIAGPQAKPAEVASRRIVSSRGRARCAAVGGIVGAIVGMVAWSALPHMQAGDFAIIGAVDGFAAAIAGAISGGRRRVIAAALAGAVIGAVVAAIVVSENAPPIRAFDEGLAGAMLIGAPGGGVLGALLGLLPRPSPHM